MSDVEQEVVRYQVDGRVAVLTLNRPERLNAWTGAVERRYLASLAAAAADQAVCAVVVTGAGRGYCAGTDMSELRQVSETGTRPLAELLSTAITRTYEFPKPVIAAVNGACAGFGLAQALACDLRFAAEDAKFTTSYARRGLVAEDGTSWLLPRLIGPARALDLLLSARVVYGLEAADLGLVNRVCPPSELLRDALGYARELAASCAPAAMALIKRQVHGHLTTDLATAITESASLVQARLASGDFREGVASFTERRPAHFAPLASDING